MLIFPMFFQQDIIYVIEIIIRISQEHWSENVFGIGSYRLIMIVFSVSECMLVNTPFSVFVLHSKFLNTIGNG